MSTLLKKPQLAAVTEATPDPYLIYRSPYLRTLSGFKLLSGTLLACGCIATPALAMTGPDGYIGAAAIAIASLLPLGIQQIVIPGFVESIRIVPPSQAKSDASSPLSREEKKRISTAPIDILESLDKASILQLETLSLLGPVRTRLETIGDLSMLKRPSRSRWSNLKSKRTGLPYYVEILAGGPILRRVVALIKEADKQRHASGDKH